MTISGLISSQPDRPPTLFDEHTNPSLPVHSSSTLQGGNHSTNRLLAYNLITLEDAERKYLDILDNEK